MKVSLNVFIVALAVLLLVHDGKAGRGVSSQISEENMIRIENLFDEIWNTLRSTQLNKVALTIRKLHELAVAVNELRDEVVKLILLMIPPSETDCRMYFKTITAQFASPLTPLREFFSEFPKMKSYINETEAILSSMDRLSELETDAKMILSIYKVRPMVIVDNEIQRDQHELEEDVAEFNLDKFRLNLTEDAVMKTILFRVDLDYENIEDIRKSEKVMVLIIQLSEKLRDVLVESMSGLANSFRLLFETVIETSNLAGTDETLTEAQSKRLLNTVRTALKKTENRINKHIGENADREASIRENEKEIASELSEVLTDVNHVLEQFHCKATVTHDEEEMFYGYLNDFDIYEAFERLTVVDGTLKSILKYNHSTIQKEAIELNNSTEKLLNDIQLFFEREHKRQQGLLKAFLDALQNDNLGDVKRASIGLYQNITIYNNMTVTKLWDVTIKMYEQNSFEHVLNAVQHCSDYLTGIAIITNLTNHHMTKQREINPQFMRMSKLEWAKHYDIYLLNTIEDFTNRRYNLHFTGSSLNISTSEVERFWYTLYNSKLYKNIAYGLMLRFFRNLEESNFIQNVKTYWQTEVLLFLESNFRLILHTGCDLKLYNFNVELGTDNFKTKFIYTRTGKVLNDYGMPNRFLSKVIQYVQVMRIELPWGSTTFKNLEKLNTLSRYYYFRQLNALLDDTSCKLYK